jgi:TnpA family transposase
MKPDGWEWFDQVNTDLEPQRAQAQQRVDDLQLAYQQAFSTSAGEVVMADLRRFLTRVKAFDPALGFYNGAAQGFYREGQNSFVAYIEQMIERGKK